MGRRLAEGRIEAELTDVVGSTTDDDGRQGHCWRAAWGGGGTLAWRGRLAGAGARRLASVGRGLTAAGGA